MKRKPVAFKAPGADYEIRVVGDRATPLRDFYHALLRCRGGRRSRRSRRRSWSRTRCSRWRIVAIGGIAHARAGSFRDAFFFSVQTMGTIGYGAMYPESTAANVLVVAESIVGLMLTALATGLVFAKFSRSTARVVFTHAGGDLADERRADADVPPRQRARQPDRRRADPRWCMVRTERPAEGGTFYRMLDLELDARARAVAVALVDRDARDRRAEPAGRRDARVAGREEVELQVMVIGIDDISMQTVHASHRYFAQDIVWGARMADVLTETPDGHLQLDLGRFHEVEPTAPARASRTRPETGWDGRGARGSRRRRRRFRRRRTGARSAAAGRGAGRGRTCRGGRPCGRRSRPPCCGSHVRTASRAARRRTAARSQ